MPSLAGKRILLGISGGIAVYKTCELIRLLVKAGVVVKVVATAHAMEFATRTTLETLSRNPLETSLFPVDGQADARHITLARWADLVVLAPATANLLAKMRTGIADDLLTTLLLATDRPILIAPAMNTQMWFHPATQENVTILQSRGYSFCGPDSGELAAANEEPGAGRMVEPETLLLTIERQLTSNHEMHGKSVLIAAGPTSEPIDAVRYISNRSTGTLGIELAEQYLRRGAEVTLLLGETPAKPPVGVRCERFSTVDSLRALLQMHVPNHDSWVMAAAVSDRKPAISSDRKIKKTALDSALPWVATPDLLADFAAGRRNNQFIVGFALEDHWDREEAYRKFNAKHVQMLVWNNPLSELTGFGTANLDARLIFEHGIREMGIVTRVELAQEIVRATIGWCCRG